MAKEAAAPYTVDEASNVLGLAISTIYNMIERGELEKADVRGKAILVTAASVDRMATKLKGAAK